jgi:predicted AAA+ superfamily ATPase
MIKFSQEKVLLLHKLITEETGGDPNVRDIALLNSALGSAFSIPDEEKRAQEIRPFRKIDDSFKKIIVTKDIVSPYYDEHGILTVNIYDFLLDSACIEN